MIGLKLGLRIFIITFHIDFDIFFIVLLALIRTAIVDQDGVSIPILSNNRPSFPTPNQRRNVQTLL